MPSREAMRVRLVTYNIHKGIGGVDRRYDLSRVVDVLNSYEPDIVLLQEVDDGVPRSRRDVQVRLLAEATGLSHLAFQHNVKLKIGHYGNAILSRYPLHEIDDVDLTIRFKKRRRALVARCRVTHEHHARTLLLANVHLGLAEFERRIQVRRLLADDHLRRLRRMTPCVIAGDFNDVWGKTGRLPLREAGFAPAAKKIKTFPAAMPIRPLDRAYVRGDVCVTGAFAGHSKVAREASDHRPLVVDLELA